MLCTACGHAHAEVIGSRIHKENDFKNYLKKPARWQVLYFGFQIILFQQKL